MKIKKILSVLISVTMCMTFLNVNSSAYNDFEQEVEFDHIIPVTSEMGDMGNIKVISREIDKDKVNENWDKFCFECENSGDVLHGEYARGTSAPTQLHRLDLSNYPFSGTVSDGSGVRLFTECYFVSNADGQIWIEGASQIYEYTNQYMRIYLYDKTANTVGYIKLDDDHVMYEENGVRKRFYYNFAFINLDTTHEYYIGFGLTSMAANYGIWGVISHDGTNEVEH